MWGAANLYPEEAAEKTLIPCLEPCAVMLEFARTVAKPKIYTLKDRKKFLYSLIHDEHIQNLIMEDKIEDAKTATLELLHRWEKKDNK